MTRPDGLPGIYGVVHFTSLAAGVVVIDVGGGFPSDYPGMEPPPLEAYFHAINRAFESLPISYSAELWCEPGRALCAEYASVLVRVEKRRLLPAAKIAGADAADALAVGKVRLLEESPASCKESAPVRSGGKVAA